MPELTTLSVGNVLIEDYFPDQRCSYYTFPQCHILLSTWALDVNQCLQANIAMTKNRRRAPFSLMGGVDQ